MQERGGSATDVPSTSNACAWPLHRSGPFAPAHAGPTTARPIGGTITLAISRRGLEHKKVPHVRQGLAPQRSRTITGGLLSLHTPKPASFHPRRATVQRGGLAALTRSPQRGQQRPQPEANPVGAETTKTRPSSPPQRGGRTIRWWAPGNLGFQCVLCLDLPAGLGVGALRM